jgi:hypothetical protein
LKDRGMAVRIPSLAALVVLLGAAALPGCAALSVPAIGTAAASGGAGALVRAGATSVRGGTVYRSFEASLPAVHAAVQATLSRLEFPAPLQQVDQEHVTLRTEAIERRVLIDLQPITPALTQLGVTAVIGTGRTDVATATAFVDAVADALEASPTRAP